MIPIRKTPKPQTFEEAVDKKLGELKEVLISKQRDYGPNNISKFGEMGVLIRASDKLERLITLLYDGKYEPSNESLDDTWTDLCNYALIALMVREGIWGLPLQKNIIDEAVSDYLDNTI